MGVFEYLMRPETLDTLAWIGGAVAATIGLVGGIPQIVRWLRKRPHLSIRDLQMVARKVPSSTFGPEGRKTVTYYWIRFDVHNAPRWRRLSRFLRVAQATGVRYTAAVCDVATGSVYHSFEERKGEMVLPPTSKFPVDLNPPQIPEHDRYRVYVYVYSDEGRPAKEDKVLKVIPEKEGNWGLRRLPNL